MKKLTIGVLSAAMILGAAGGFAQAKENGEGLFNFGQMKPQMEEVHPDLSTKELKEMYDSCHETEGGGMMEGVDTNLDMDNFMNETDNMDFNNMMNNF